MASETGPVSTEKENRLSTSAPGAEIRPFLLITTMKRPTLWYCWIFQTRMTRGSDECLQKCVRANNNAVEYFHFFSITPRLEISASLCLCAYIIYILSRPTMTTTTCNL